MCWHVNWCNSSSSMWISNNHRWQEELALASELMAGWNKWPLTVSPYAMLIRTWAKLKSYRIEQMHFKTCLGCEFWSVFFPLLEMRRSKTKGLSSVGPPAHWFIFMMKLWSYVGREYELNFPNELSSTLRINQSHSQMLSTSHFVNLY